MSDLPSQNQPNDETLVPLQHDWLRGFIGALSAFQLYPPVHPKAQAALDLLLQVTVALQAVYNGDLSLAHAEQGVMINDSNIDPTITAFHRLADELRHRHIHSLIFSQGVERTELEKCMAIFALPPQRVVERGGLALLLQQAEIEHIRPAMLRYAGRDESAQLDEAETEDERVLFARMEECLQDENRSGSGTGSEVTVFLENPKAAARYLEQKLTATDTDADAVEKVVDALEKVGSLAYSQNPEAWGESKQKIAEALYFLSPTLRENTLDVACKKSSESTVLEEIIFSLQPDQIASILTEMFARDYAANGNEKEDLERARYLASMLVKSPDQFQLLRPLLLQEMQGRGIPPDAIEKYMHYVRGEEKIAAPADSVQPEVASEKMQMYEASRLENRQQRDGMENLYNTLTLEGRKNSLRRIRLELLEREDSLAFYHNVLGPQVVADIQEAKRTNEIDVARDELTWLLRHTDPTLKNAGFSERAQITRGLLLKLDAPWVADLFLDALPSEPGCEVILRAIVRARLPQSAQEIVRYAFDNERLSPNDTLSKIIAGEIEAFAPCIRKWLEDGNNPNHPILYYVLSNNLCAACVPALRILAEKAHRENARRAIALLGRLGNNDALLQLETLARKGGHLAQWAMEEIKQISHPAAIPFLLREINRPFWQGGNRNSRMQAFDRLAQIDNASCRDAASEVLKQWLNGSFFRFKRPLILHGMDSLQSWPRKEALNMLERVLEKKDTILSARVMELKNALQEGSDSGK